MTPKPHREGELAGLEVKHAETRIGVAADDGIRVRRSDMLDLDPTLGRAHEQDPALGPIEDGGEVELLHDVRGRADQDLADRHALDVHAEDAAGDLGGLVRARCELHPAGLAATAHQDLGLDDDLAADRPRIEEALRGRPGLIRRVGDRPLGDREPLGDEQ